MWCTLLGPVAIVADGRRHALARGQTRGLLALLALDVGRPVSTSAAIEALWAGTAPPTARAQVHAAAAAVRRGLAEAGAPRALHSGPFGYRLAIEPATVDASLFDLRLRLARAAVPADPDRAVELYRAALDLWRGEPLADATGAFVASARARLNDRRLAAVEELTAVELDNGRAVEVADEVAPLVAAHPMRERLRARLMTALYDCGRRVEALETFHAYRTVLAEEQGLDPGREITELATVLLRSDQPPRVPRPRRPPHPRRPAARSSPVRAGIAAAAAPAGRRRPVPPAQLPPDIRDFAGRAAEVHRLLGLLTAPPGRPHRPAPAVASISGMAGVGKTALAVHVAHRAAASYPDGQLFVSLRGADRSPLDPADVLGRFLRALGVDGRAMPADAAERADLYRSRLAGSRTLVVLDDAAGDEQVRPLLPGAGGCGVLVTCRARLALPGAHQADLDVFAPDEAVRLLGLVAGGHRVANEPDDAAAIVRLCDRLPLAVRIAGSRLNARPAWTLSHLTGLLGDQHRRLDRLAVGDLAVRASLALSYDGLDPDARTLFRLLGLFDQRAFPSWLAAAVLDSPLDDAVGRLERLVDAQLLTVVGTDPAGHNRYRFHDLVRLFARDRAEAEDADPLRAAALTRGFGACLAIAERMATRVPGPCYVPLHGPAPRTVVAEAHARLAGVDAIAWFDTECAGLRAAIRQACDLGRTDVAFDLAGCLEKYFDIRGRYHDWRATNELVAHACAERGDRLGHAVMRRGLVDVLTWHSDEPGGDAMARLHADAAELERAFADLGEPRGQADALVTRSWGLTARGRYAEAVDAARRSLELATATDHAGGRARAHVALAVAHGEHRELAPALEHLQRALEVAGTLDNPRYEATVLQFLGIAYCRAGEADAGLRVVERSLATFRRYGDGYAEALSLLTQARLYGLSGDPRARQAAGAALEIARDYDMGHHVADALGVLGELALAEGDGERAVAHLSESVALWRARGWPSFLATALRALGRAHAAHQPGADPAVAREKARAAWTEARGIAEALGDDTTRAELDALLAGLPAASG